MLVFRNVEWEIRESEFWKLMENVLACFHVYFCYLKQRHRVERLLSPRSWILSRPPEELGHFCTTATMMASASIVSSITALTTVSHPSCSLTAVTKRRSMSLPSLLTDSGGELVAASGMGTRLCTLEPDSVHWNQTPCIGTRMGMKKRVLYILVPFQISILPLLPAGMGRTFGVGNMSVFSNWSLPSPWSKARTVLG